MLEHLEIHQQMFRYYRLRDQFAQRRQTHKLTPGASRPGGPARRVVTPPADPRAVQSAEAQGYRHG